MTSIYTSRWRYGLPDHRWIPYIRSLLFYSISGRPQIRRASDKIRPDILGDTRLGAKYSQRRFYSSVEVTSATNTNQTGDQRPARRKQGLSPVEAFNPRIQEDGSPDQILRRDYGVTRDAIQAAKSSDTLMKYWGLLNDYLTATRPGTLDLARMLHLVQLIIRRAQQLQLPIDDEKKTNLDLFLGRWWDRAKSWQRGFDTGKLSLILLTFGRIGRYPLYPDTSVLRKIQQQFFSLMAFADDRDVVSFLQSYDLLKFKLDDDEFGIIESNILGFREQHVEHPTVEQMEDELATWLKIMSAYDQQGRYFCPRMRNALENNLHVVVHHASSKSLVNLVFLADRLKIVFVGHVYSAIQDRIMQLEKAAGQPSSELSGVQQLSMLKYILEGRNHIMNLRNTYLSRIGVDQKLIPERELQNLARSYSNLPNVDMDNLVAFLVSKAMISKASQRKNAEYLHSVIQVSSELGELLFDDLADWESGFCEMSSGFDKPEMLLDVLHAWSRFSWRPARQTFFVWEARFYEMIGQFSEEQVVEAFLYVTRLGHRLTDTSLDAIVPIVLPRDMYTTAWYFRKLEIPPTESLKYVKLFEPALKREMETLSDVSRLTEVLTFVDAHGFEPSDELKALVAEQARLRLQFASFRCLHALLKFLRIPHIEMNSAEIAFWDDWLKRFDRNLGSLVASAELVNNSELSEFSPDCDNRAVYDNDTDQLPSSWNLNTSLDQSQSPKDLPQAIAMAGRPRKSTFTGTRVQTAIEWPLYINVQTRHALACLRSWVNLMEEQRHQFTRANQSVRLGSNQRMDFPIPASVLDHIEKICKTRSPSLSPIMILQVLDILYRVRACDDSKAILPKEKNFVIFLVTLFGLKTRTDVPEWVANRRLIWSEFGNYLRSLKNASRSSE